MPHNFLSGLSYPVLGRYEESGEEGKKQLGRLRTMRSPRRPSRIATLVRINRRRPLAHKQWKHKLNHAVFAAATYEIAFLQNDVTGMQADVQPVMARADYPFLCRLRPLQQPVTQLHKFCHQGSVSRPAIVAASISVVNRIDVAISALHSKQYFSLFPGSSNNSNERPQTLHCKVDGSSLPLGPHNMELPPIGRSSGFSLSAHNARETLVQKS